MPTNARATLSDYIRTREFRPEVLPALASLAGHIRLNVKDQDSLAKVPSAVVPNVRNDMYLASESIRFLEKNPPAVLDEDGRAHLKTFRHELDKATKFIPLWVKIAVAIALGLGTMVGWKRIVITVGEKIGKTHLTYAQGASAELIAMTTIGAADIFGLPVSTTHVLSSGVAGSMVANRSGLHNGTVRTILLAWVLTLPASMLLASGLFALAVYVLGV